MRNNFRSKSKESIMFPNVRILVFLFSLFVCVFLQKHDKARGFSQCWAQFLLGVKKIGSITGPQLGQ